MFSHLCGVDHVQFFCLCSDMVCFVLFHCDSRVAYRCSVKLFVLDGRTSEAY